MISSMIWMQLSAVIVFLGAAWNAESEQGRKNKRCFFGSGSVSDFPVIRPKSRARASEICNFPQPDFWGVEKALIR